MFQLGTDTTEYYKIPGSENDKYVALTFLRNAEVAAEGMEYRFLMQQGSGNFTPVADDEE